MRVPAAFFVVFVFFPPAFFLAAIRMPSCRGSLTASVIYMTYMVTYVTCQTKKLDG